MESPLKRSVSHARLRSPLPDFAHGGITISRLERSAEELSAGGSDIGEEIKKMRARERSVSRCRSRQNSLHSSHHGEFASSRGTSLPRRISSSGPHPHPRHHHHHHHHHHQFAAPVGSVAEHTITSPIGSLTSRSSWTQASIHRAASESRVSRLGLSVVEPMQEGRPLDSPLAPSSASLYSQEHAISRQPSQSSFARRYDLIAGQIQESLATIPPTPPMEETSEEGEPGARMDHDPIERPHSADTFQEAQTAFRDFDGVHYKPDTEEYVELDQDGQEIRRVSARTSSGTLGDMSTMMRTPRQSRPMSSGRPPSQGRPMSMALGAPPPGEDMVYYPAPVPRMLNLPKRLSQQPPAHIQAKRRSEMLQAMPKANRESAPWIPPMTFDENEQENATRSVRSGSGSTAGQEQHPRGMLNQRMSMANPQSLPPQLRASMFFQQPSVEHDIQVQNGSAVATLDAILASSANAPVTAFTDHPYAGDVHRTVYAPEKPQHNRQSTTTTLEPTKAESPKTKGKKKSRSSSFGNFFKRTSTNIDGETDARKRLASQGSVLDLKENGNKLRKKRSQMSLGQMSAGDEVERADRAARTPGEEPGDPTRRESGLIAHASNVDQTSEEEAEQQRTASGQQQPDRVLNEGEQVDQDFKDAKEREDWDLEDPLFAQPTTLLAELQVRKAQLKSRNKTAATAFPNGMHSTLLQLDAVEAIEAKKRQKKKIALAWEDHQGNTDDNSDDDKDDVPLGMLFPPKSGNLHRMMGNERDWSRPLGLIERRELEENEPLGHRRKRLNPHAQPIPKPHAIAQLHLAGQPDMPSEDEADEGETLGQRLRRLKTKEALDGAISDVHRDGQQPDSSFTDELLGQFGGLQITNPDAAASEQSTTKEQAKSGAAEEDETLGQRAARLRREREASGESAQDGTRHSVLRSASSMANLLSSNPVGSRHVRHDLEAAQGTLLHVSEQHQMRHKQDLLARNMRASSYNLGQPLVDSRPRADADMTSGLIANESSRPANGLFAGAKHTAGINTSGSAAAPNRSTSYGGLLGQQQSRPTNMLFNATSYNNGYGGSSLLPSTSTPVFAGQGYFASPTAGMSYGGYAQPTMMGYPQMQQYPPQMMDPASYYALHGVHSYPQQQNRQPPPLQQHMAVSQQPAMSAPVAAGFAEPAQASSIERWRQNIAPA